MECQERKKKTEVPFENDDFEVPKSSSKIDRFPRVILVQTKLLKYFPICKIIDDGYLSADFITFYFPSKNFLLEKKN